MHGEGTQQSKMNVMLQEWRTNVQTTPTRNTDSWITKATSLKLFAHSFLLYILIGQQVIAGTIAPCGWRGTKNIRCFVDANGDGIWQEGEKHMPNGIHQMDHHHQLPIEDG